MASLNINLQRLSDARDNIAQAIVSKGGTVGTYDGFEDFPDDIDSIPTGSSTPQMNDVNFYDYDGTILYSYTAEEFLSLTDMPANPNRTSDGLSAMGWNWSLSDAKSYVQSYGILNIGQMYITSDGKFRLDIDLSSYTSSVSVTLKLNSTSTSSASTVYVDWGDDNTSSVSVKGSSFGTATSISHTYNTFTKYSIKLNTTTTGSTTIFFGSGNKSTATPVAAVTPTNILTAFYEGSSNIVAKCEKEGAWNSKALKYCTFYYNNLSYFHSTSVLTTEVNESLIHITIPQSRGATISGCKYLKSISYPSTASGIDVSKCYSLENVTPPILSTTSTPDYLTASLTSVKKLICTAPTTSFGGNNIVANDYQLEYIEFPSTLTTFGDDVSEVTSFKNCFKLNTIKFNSTTPPTVTSSNMWNTIANNYLTIYVPQASLSAYRSATNYLRESAYVKYIGF